ncbi:copper chaperone PCu(A)C [Roseateles koreensis]|uniref:Copper chaperone PCu(A)C n=1 Tax=Roseateles koreensis TaxID=2987526 RepID=A0ABT5KS83_9BURK|nr:copper chaperone PCu(A)C [Roseateles koreensis]MDC8784731.1 copper chaperone PCu(A)C [Roseateles koreensis]
MSIPAVLTRFSTPLIAQISAGLGALLIAASAQAQVEVSQPWVRATVAQQKATGAFFKLTAKMDSRLVEVRSPVASEVEVHEMAMEGNTMKMRAVPALDLPAGKTIELKPGSYHVMLMGLKAPVNVGDSVPLTLVFEGKDKIRETVDIKAEARQMGTHGAMKPEPNEEHKHH